MKKIQSCRLCIETLAAEGSVSYLISGTVLTEVIITHRKSYGFVCGLYGFMLLTGVRHSVLDPNIQLVFTIYVIVNYLHMKYFMIYSRCHSSLSCINEYLATNTWISEQIVMQQLQRC